MKFLLLVFAFFFTLTVNSLANSINASYRFCNHHKFTYFFLKVYDVNLCANDKKYFFPEKIYQTDFSLIIKYNLNFARKEFAKSSIEEINRYYQIGQMQQNSYYQKLMQIFPNVKEGDIIEARYLNEGIVELYHNNSLTGKITDPEFAKIFLDIWLFGQNKYEKMTKDLYGQS